MYVKQSVISGSVYQLAKVKKKKALDGNIDIERAGSMTKSSPLFFVFLVECSVQSMLWNETNRVRGRSIAGQALDLGRLSSFFVSGM